MSELPSVLVVTPEADVFATARRALAGRASVSRCEPPDLITAVREAPPVLAAIDETCGPAVLAVAEAMLPPGSWVVIGADAGNPDELYIPRGCDDFRLWSFALRIAREVHASRDVRALLRDGERQRVAGEVAAGIAHEINNPLSAVAVNLDFALQSLDRSVSRELRYALMDARSATERAMEVATDLRDIGRPIDVEPRSLDPREAADAAIRMVNPQISRVGRITREYTASPRVHAQPGRLHQVLVNALLNAVHALDGVPNAEIKVRVGRAPSGVAIEVRDNGPGIPPEVLQRVFEPFFTTKATGTGLGLALCREYMQQMGGAISIDSAPGDGTTVRLSLPPAPRSASLARATLVPHDHPERRGRIVVVDDDATVGRAFARILSREHDVTVLQGGKQAIAFLVVGKPFDVLLLDLVMPGVDGRQVYEALERLRPEAVERVVLLTGGSAERGTAEFLESVRGGALLKPVGADQLMAVVRDKLQERTPVPSPSRR